MTQNWRGLLRHLGWEAYLSFLGLLVLVLLPILLIFFIPTFIWRPIACTIRPYLRPDLGKILSCASSAFAQVDDVDSSKSVIVVQASFKGILDYETTLKQIQERWIDCKKPENSALRYPELQQFITNWAGYKFWQREKDFNLRNHVHLVKNTNISKTSQDIHQLGQDLLCGSFPQGRSPWDCTLVPGVIIDGQLGSVCYIRVHHALADGYSILFLAQRLFGEEKAPSFKPRYAPQTPGYFFRLPYKVLRLVGELAYNTASSFLWKIPEQDKSPLWSYCVSGKAIPVSSILQIKNHFSVSFSTVVLALLSGGVHHFLARRGGEQKSRKQIIETLPTVIVTPTKSHPMDMLCNKFSFAMLSYPVGCQDPVERLEMLHQSFESLRDSPVSIIGYFAVRLHGSHFNAVGKFINSYRYAPFLTTYFPIGSPTWSLQGCSLTDFSFYLRLQQGQQGAMFCISSFHDWLNLAAVFNATLLSDGEVAELCADIEREAQLLLEASKKKKMIANKKCN